MSETVYRRNTDATASDVKAINGLLYSGALRAFRADELVHLMEIPGVHNDPVMLYRMHARSHRNTSDVLLEAVWAYEIDQEET